MIWPSTNSSPPCRLLFSRGFAVFRAMGEDFIAFSFKVAEEVEPSVKLYYNDFNIERYINDKIRAAHALVKRAKEAGARIDGIGMQDHARVGNAQSKKELMDTMAFFSEVVDELAYTEVDIRHTKMPVTDADREQQALDYMEVVSACLETEKCVGISVWDFTDQVRHHCPGGGGGFRFLCTLTFACFLRISPANLPIFLLLCSTHGSPTSFQEKETPASTIETCRRNQPTTASSACFKAPPKPRPLHRTPPLSRQSSLQPPMRPAPLRHPRIQRQTRSRKTSLPPSCQQP